MNTKTLQSRLARLLPGGVPRYIRAYDNGGATLDRYTVCFTGRAGSQDGWYSYRGMSADPFNPQGFGQWGSNQGQPVDTYRKKPGWHFPPALGRSCHLGKRITFADLPDDCQKLVSSDYREIWNLNPNPEAHNPAMLRALRSLAENETPVDHSELARLDKEILIADKTQEALT